MKSFQVFIGDAPLYEGEAIPVPRVGDVIHRGDDVVPVEAVTWDFRDAGAVKVTIVVGNRPYTF